MPLLGAHMSIACGCHNALLAAKEHACDTVQLFTKNNNQWRGKPLTAVKLPPKYNRAPSVARA